MNDRVKDKTSEKVTVMPEEKSPMQEEMDELKREMRSAKWFEWAQAHQKHLIGAVAVLVIGLAGSGLWIERDRAQAESAATLYQQAINETNIIKKQVLLDSISSQFSSTSYAALAMMQLARVDQANAAAHLKNLIANSHAMEEWIWQARLDLAEINIINGDKVAAQALLEKIVGKQYQQLRYYLLATLSNDAAEKTSYLKKALNAESHDELLKQKITTLLPQQAT